MTHASRQIHRLFTLAAEAGRAARLLLPGLLVCPALAQPLDFRESAAGAGLVHTFSPAAGYPGAHDQMVGGVTAADFNNDGWPDLYALGGGNQPDRLFLNRGPGQPGLFEEADPDAWNLPAPHRGAALAAGDVNRDGLIDLYIVSYGPVPAPASNAAHMLLLNRGGRFENAAAQAGVDRLAPAVDGMSPTLGDIDNDGDLDLFVCAWFPNSNANRLFINTGTGPGGIPVFTDATDAMGPDLSPLRGFTARMIDLTGNRLPDLLINGDFGTSRLLINLGLGPDGLPRFTDATIPAGITEDTNAMGLDIADADNDGDPDWFISNIYSDLSGETNTLYLNHGLDPATGIPFFVDAADQAGVADAGWAWGAVFADFDHDTDLDLAVTGGWFQHPPTPSRLFRNDGVNDGVPRFTEHAAEAGLGFTGLGRTIATLDADRDGDLDIILSATNTPLRFFRNDGPASPAATTPGCNWLTVTLDTAPNPCVAPNGRHARIRVETPGPAGTIITQSRILDFGPTFLGHPQPIAHFGLADHDEATRVRIDLPDGSTRVLDHVPANQHLAVTLYHPADFNRDGLFTPADLPLFAAGFLAGDSAADLNNDGLLDLADIVRFARALGGSPCAPPPSASAFP